LENGIEIETPNGSGVFKIEDCSDLPFCLPLNVIAVPVHFLRSRKLFSAEPDKSGFLCPGAEKARIKK